MFYEMRRNAKKSSPKTLALYSHNAYILYNIDGDGDYAKFTIRIA